MYRELLKTKLKSLNVSKESRKSYEINNVFGRFCSTLSTYMPDQSQFI
jgi:hypothetical protein